MTQMRRKRRAQRHWSKLGLCAVGPFCLIILVRTHLRSASAGFFEESTTNNKRIPPEEQGLSLNYRGELSSNKELPLFGVEMEYLYPNSTLMDTATESQQLDRISTALEDHGIWNEPFLSKAQSKQKPTSIDTWMVVSENRGFELVSPIGPTLDSIETVVATMQELQVGILSSESQLHVCIDARNKSLSQVRNVYKNFIIAERALDLVRKQDFRAGHSIKTASLTNHMARDKILSQLDTCQIFECLKAIAQPKPKPFLYVMNLRREGSPSEMFYRPSRIEFRGQQSSLDTKFILLWVRLLQKFVQASFDGIILDGERQTVDETWTELFDKLIRDDELHSYFDGLRERLEQEDQATDIESRGGDLSDMIEKLIQENRQRQEAAGG